MAQLARRVITEELSQLRRITSDDTLTALQVAIYLEDALDVILPDQFLTAEHLGSTAAVERTLAAIAGKR